jgi:hypothetical protein
MTLRLERPPSHIVGNFTTVMLPFNIASENRWKSRHYLQFILYDQCLFRFFKGGRLRPTGRIELTWLECQQEVIGHIISDIQGNAIFQQYSLKTTLPKDRLQILRVFCSMPMAVIQNSESVTGACCFCDQFKDALHGEICEWWLSDSPQYKKSLSKTCWSCDKQFMPFPPSRAHQYFTVTQRFCSEHCWSKQRLELEAKEKEEKWKKDIAKWNKEREERWNKETAWWDKHYIYKMKRP